MINNVHALTTAALRENPALSPEYVRSKTKNKHFQELGDFRYMTYRNRF